MSFSQIEYYVLFKAKLLAMYHFTTSIFFCVPKRLLSNTVTNQKHSPKKLQNSKSNSWENPKRAPYAWRQTEKSVKPDQDGTKRNQQWQQVNIAG
ncbi:hypothetical protein TNCV_1436391 [Trichonephila clavipes]|nr:hypothetical protein TNCV_1436391 [Trichonephila clavipes]